MFCLGDVLGLESDPVNLPPMNPLSNKTSEDYVFVHTNSHHEFMDLLLEKRKGLENTIISSEQERRSSMTQMKHAEKSDSKGKFSNKQFSCCENFMVYTPYFKLPNCRVKFS